MASSLESRSYKNLRVISFTKLNRVNKADLNTTSDVEYVLSQVEHKYRQLYIDSHFKFAKLPFNEASWFLGDARDD